VARLSSAFVLLAALVAVAAGVARGGPAPAETTCVKYGTVSVAENRYVYQQNEWNSDREQCARVRGTAFTLTEASFDLPTNGPPATYPSFFRGCHWGNCTFNSGLPRRVGGLRSVTSTWHTRQPASGAYNVTLDVWMNKAAATSGQPDGSEIMIWLNSRGPVQPFGSRVATVRLAGTRWAVWYGRASAWSVISYRRLQGTTGVRNLDVKAFLDDSVERGYTKKRWFLITGEAGFEIWKGGKGLATTFFSFAVE
jgi:hypothetical protein